MDSADDGRVSTSKKSLLLKPEEANISDLFHFLFSGEIESKDFIECLQAKETSLKRRFLMFISLAVQKSLQTMATPLQLSGSVAEFCLNLISNNYELLLLLRGNKKKKNEKKTKTLNLILFCGDIKEVLIKLIFCDIYREFNCAGKRFSPFRVCSRTS